MTTLRDYILDCRCPNCGLLMQQRAPEKRKGWRALAVPFVVTFVVVGAVVYSLEGAYAHAAFAMSLATFLVVTDR